MIFADKQIFESITDHIAQRSVDRLLWLGMLSKFSAIKPKLIF
jgi:hypothetical protein